LDKQPIQQHTQKRVQQPAAQNDTQVRKRVEGKNYGANKMRCILSAKKADTHLSLNDTRLNLTPRRSNPA